MDRIIADQFHHRISRVEDTLRRAQTAPTIPKYDISIATAIGIPRYYGSLNSLSGETSFTVNNVSTDLVADTDYVLSIFRSESHNYIGADGIVLVGLNDRAIDAAKFRFGILSSLVALNNNFSYRIRNLKIGSTLGASDIWFDSLAIPPNSTNYTVVDSSSFSATTLAGNSYTLVSYNGTAPAIATTKPDFDVPECYVEFTLNFPTNIITWLSDNSFGGNSDNFAAFIAEILKSSGGEFNPFISSALGSNG